MSVDQVLPEIESGVRCPGNGKTSARAVVKPGHEHRVGHLVRKPHGERGREDHSERRTRGSRDWPVVPARPDQADNQTRPEGAQTLL